MVGILAVYSAQRAARHHSGRYVCGAVNPAGGVMTRVNVRIRPSHLLPPPIISVPPANQTLPLRGHAALTCRVWGEPQPMVSWRHRGRPLRSSARHKIHSDNTLTIDGKYKQVISYLIKLLIIKIVLIFLLNINPPISGF